MNKTLKLFYKFLEANGALIAWEQNYTIYQAKLDEPKSRAEYFHRNTAAAHRWIMRAFCWSHTPQGYDYWSDLHYKWINHLSQNN